MRQKAWRALPQAPPIRIAFGLYMAIVLIKCQSVGLILLFKFSCVIRLLAGGQENQRALITVVLGFFWC